MIQIVKFLKPFEYSAAVAAMENYSALVASEQQPEAIWLLQHPAVYTAGRTAQLQPAFQQLTEINTIPFVATSRGGKVTYHGPGQRIVWLILRYKNYAANIREFVDLLQSWIISVLSEFGISATRNPEHIGVWISAANQTSNKVAAVGLRISKGLSTYGLAVNVAVNLAPFQAIDPCGISTANLGITTVNQCLAKPVSMEEFDQVLVSHVQKYFSVPMETRIRDHC